jgi:ribosomal protein S18 acetylase RimI-like enzyme
VVLVADRGGELVGAVAYLVPREREWKWIPDDWAGIRVLAVPPRHRGHGIGRLLTAACVERAREQGAAGIGLMTTEMMAVAKEMYERMGFEQMKEYQTDYPVRFWSYGMGLGDGGRDS